MLVKVGLIDCDNAQGGAGFAPETNPGPATQSRRIAPRGRNARRGLFNSYDSGTPPTERERELDYECSMKIYGKRKENGLWCVLATVGCGTPGTSLFLPRRDRECPLNSFGWCEEAPVVSSVWAPAGDVPH